MNLFLLQKKLWNNQKPMTQKTSYIRDPIHNSIAISAGEKAVIGTAVFQRLRNIKQLGFLDFAFPAATHSRYVHSLGAMVFATKMFEQLFAPDFWPTATWQRTRQAVRLAAMLHDLGHPPLSHTTESLMPPIRELDPNNQSSRQAKHEDYTVLLLLQSELSAVIRQEFDLDPVVVAAIINAEYDNKFFVVNGADFGPVLRQIISSDLDADRMDYLLRDSYFCGVNYGKFDSDWLITNLTLAPKENSYYMGIKSRALLSLADYFFSRLQMFHSVYFHHTPIIMEKMLERFFKSGEFQLPKDLGAYALTDDIDLWSALKKSHNPWAQRICARRPYLVLQEQVLADDEEDRATPVAMAALEEAGIDAIFARSKAAGALKKPTIPTFVIDDHGRAQVLSHYHSQILPARAAMGISRIFVDEKDMGKAQKIIPSF
jgi:HD superfamily phosphohydrolase